MTNAAAPEWSHVGLCVSDLERAIRFYCEGLGCALAERYELDSSWVSSTAQSQPPLASSAQVALSIWPIDWSAAAMAPQVPTSDLQLAGTLKLALSFTSVARVMVVAVDMASSAPQPWAAHCRRASSIGSNDSATAADATHRSPHRMSDHRIS